ncbi:hypothetical protein D3C80_1617070 [compost metagenome]
MTAYFFQIGIHTYLIVRLAFMRQVDRHFTLPGRAACQLFGKLWRQAFNLGRLPIAFQPNVNLIILFAFQRIEVDRQRLPKPVGRQGIALQVAVVETELAAHSL